MFHPLTFSRRAGSFRGWPAGLLYVAVLIVSANGFTRAQEVDPSVNRQEKPAQSTEQKAVRKPKIPRLGADQLPWPLPHATPATANPDQEIKSARELFLSIDASQWSQFVDGRPLTDEERETLQLFLYQFSRVEIYRYRGLQDDKISSSEMLEEPAANRAKVVRLAGRVKRVQQVQLAPEEATLLEFKHYFRVTMRLDDSPHDVQVYTRFIPEAWQLDREVDYQASAFGLFLKTGKSDESQSSLIFVADRVAWHPNREDKNSGITADHAWLGDLGMDVGLLDIVREKNGKGLTVEEADCFYQMLSVMNKVQATEMSRRAPDNFDLTSLLKNPRRYHGHLMIVEGNAREVTKINIDQADVQARYGLNHYYQIDAFVSLGDKKVRLGKGTEDNPAPVFSNGFPVTICVRRLPENLKQAMTESDGSFNERVRVPVFFYKIWSYKSEFISDFDERQRQPAPMLIGLEPEMIDTRPRSNPYLGSIFGTVFVIALAGIWFGIWRYNRGDKKFSKATLHRQFEIPADKSLDEMGIEAKDGPDFSNLD